MRDFQHDRKKKLDLVVCTPAINQTTGKLFSDLANEYGIELSPIESSELDSLPPIREAVVGSVLVALEAKACMTAHQKSLPRLYDELHSSHQTTHGASESAIAAGVVMINIAPRFISPKKNVTREKDPVWSKHRQPKSVEITIDKVRQLPRRGRTDSSGFDALAIVVVDCANDGSPVKIHLDPPAPQSQDTHHYDSMIDRLCSLYDTRFGRL